MNIFEQAMKLEKEGETLYREFAGEAPNAGMKKIFTWLADQEARHFRFFQTLKAGKSVEVAESPILRDLKEIFNGWKNSEVCVDVKTTQADLYRRALDIENKSISVYENYANVAATPQQKDLFLAIVREEKRHRWILENIIEFVTKPEIWAENAEFSHLDEGYYL